MLAFWQYFYIFWSGHTKTLPLYLFWSQRAPYLVIKLVFCTIKSTEKWTGRNRGTGEGVGRLEAVVLVPSSGKTVDYRSWNIYAASVITSTAWPYIRLSKVLMKNWQSMRQLFSKLHQPAALLSYDRNTVNKLQAHPGKGIFLVYTAVNSCSSFRLSVLVCFAVSNLNNDSDVMCFKRFCTLF